MHLSLLIATWFVVLVSAAPNSLPWLSVLDRRADEDTIKFSSSAEFEDAWEAFKINYGKSYKDAAEELFRKKIFAKHLKTIEIHNYLYSKGLKTFTMGINQFADMENSEFVALMTGYFSQNLSDVSGGSIYFAPEVSFTIGDEVDWRSKGYVTPVKNQGKCGSCWAFSATGSLEGQHFRKTGKLVSLSEQNLVDCSTDNHGCKGGRFTTAFKYIQANGGIDVEDSYPYEGKENDCRYNPSTSAATCTGFVNILRESELELKIAVASVGPISVGIDANHGSFQLYKDGVYDEPKCSSLALNHAVLVVGYGTTDSGQDYWIVKNSWGETWGMKGYILMSRSKNNQCGIATIASYPLV